MTNAILTMKTVERIRFQNRKNQAVFPTPGDDRLIENQIAKKSGKDSAEKQIRNILGTPHYSAAPLSPDYLDNVRKKITEIILENK